MESRNLGTELLPNQELVIITYFLDQQIKFRSSDVHVPDIPGMFTTFKARNVPLFVESGQFYSIYHYGKIMGYEKPLPKAMRCACIMIQYYLDSTCPSAPWPKDVLTNKMYNPIISKSTFSKCSL